ncbi:hypothetical protein LSAT2_011113 [Lamellibrachia satsuma]|nr:hypothetical protein LSAT2_011113 [Lamellibrachia satsuma]
MSELRCGKMTCCAMFAALWERARPAIGPRRQSVSDDVIPGTIRYSSTGHLGTATEQSAYGTSQYGRDHQHIYHTDNHNMAPPVPPMRTSKPGGSQNEAHPPPSTATQAWLTSASAVKSHGMAQNRGTDVGRSPALEKRVNLRSRDQSPAPGGRAGMVNGAFNYEEGELLSPPTPLPLRSHSIQGGAQSPGVRGGYGREGEDSGVHSYVPSRPSDGAIYGSRPPSAQNRNQQPAVLEAMNKPPQIPPKYLPPPQYSPYCVAEGATETAHPQAPPVNDMRSACSKLYTTTNYTQMNGACSPHPVPKYPSGIYSNVHARQTPSGSSGSPQSYSSQLSPTLKRHDADRLRRYSQHSSTQEEEWKPTTPSMSRNHFSGTATNQHMKPDMTPTSQRRQSGEMTPTSHRRGSCVTFSDTKAANAVGRGVGFNMNANAGMPKPAGQLSPEQQYNSQQMSPCVRRPPVLTSSKVAVSSKQLSPRSHLPQGSQKAGYCDTKKLYNSLASDDDDNFSVSSMSDTPPLPALSPDNTPPTTPPHSPRHKVAAHLSTPDVINSATKESTKRSMARKSAGHVSLKTWDGRGKRVNPGKAASRGPRNKSGGSRGFRSYGMLDDLVESDDFGGSTTNMSNTEDGLEETTLNTREVRMMRRQMEGLEAMYQEMLKAVGLDKEYGAGSRHSISSASSMARSTRRFGRQQQQHRHHRELKQVNKRFARLESHVVTLARSVAHLSSEVHSQNTLRQDIEALKVDIQDVRKDVKVVGGKTPLNEWERFRGWVPSLTNPKRVKKLTKFFGQEPPLLHIFLRKLNYEKYIPKFDAEKITMVELPYMTEEMLQKIGIPLGPSRRILQEAQMCFRQENFNIYIV